MGYSTDFSGTIRVDPPLNREEAEYLRRFNRSRRMLRAEGPYFVDGPGDLGQDVTGTVIDADRPPQGQPSLWCPVRPVADGSALAWDGGEKAYDLPLWVRYIIDHFLGPRATAPMGFLTKDHVLNGVMEAQGEDREDRWDLVVEDNRVWVLPYSAVAVAGMRREVK